MDDTAAVFILFLAGYLCLLVWAYRDASARGLSGAAWVVVIILFPLLGLIIYLYQRPRGRLVACASCGQLRPESAWVCPHCHTRTQTNK
jgi:hypothetical protein